MGSYLSSIQLGFFDPIKFGASQNYSFVNCNVPQFFEVYEEIKTSWSGYKTSYLYYVLKNTHEIIGKSKKTQYNQFEKKLWELEPYLHWVSTQKGNKLSQVFSEFKHALNQEEFSLLHSMIDLIPMREMELFFEQLDPNFDFQKVDSDGNSLVHAAVLKNNHKMLTFLVEKTKTDLNKRNNQGKTPLHLSVELSKDSFLQCLLLSPRVNLVVQNIAGKTALHLAIEESNSGAITKIVEAMNSLNISTNNYDNNGNCPFHYAIMKDDAYSLSLCMKSKDWDNEFPNEKSQTPIQIAIQLKSIECIAKLAQNHANFLQRDSDLNTILHIAASKAKYLDLLVSLAPKLLNAPNRDLKTPLHIAVESNMIPCVEFLVKQKSIQLDCRDKEENTPLHLAASKSEHIMQILIESGASINFQNINGYTPLHLALKHSIPVSLLLDRTNLSVRDFNGNTYLHIATEVGNVVAIEKILKRTVSSPFSNSPFISASPSSSVSCLIDERNNNGYTAFHLASLENNPHNLNSLVPLQLLIQFGANINAVCNTDKNTPLHLVAMNGNLPRLKLLLTLPNIIVNPKNRFQQTPTQAALEKHHLDCFFTLVEAGGDINSLTSKGSNIFEIILSKHNTLAFEKAITLGADPNIKNINTGNTPLHLASSYGTFYAEKLYHAGAVLDAKNEKWETPLYMAILEKNIPLIEWLIEVGADVLVKDKKDKTIFHLAVEKNLDLQILEKLYKKGANLSIVDKSRKAPIHYCTNEAIERWIREKLTTPAPKITCHYCETTPSYILWNGRNCERCTRWICNQCLISNAGQCLNCWAHSMSSPQQALEKLYSLSSPSLRHRKSLQLSLDQLTITLEQKTTSVKRRNTFSGLAREREKAIQREDIKFGALIGRGAIGAVYSCTYLPTRGKYALKLFDLSSLVESEKRQQVTLCFKNELKLLAQLEHPNIVNLFGYCISSEELILVMDFCDSNLKDFFKNGNYKPCSILQVINFSKDILKGLSYLHSQKIGHRDLKPENILIKFQGLPIVESLQIADFGISRLFDDEETMLATTNMLGTLTYMSPEVTKEVTYDALKSDIFSFGIILLELITGKPPRRKLQDVTLGIMPSIPDSEFQSTIRKCTSLDPKMRPTALELLKEIEQKYNN